MIAKLQDNLVSTFHEHIKIEQTHIGEIIVTAEPLYLLTLCSKLRDLPQFKFVQLIDLLGVDYLTYGTSEWETVGATRQGFSRAKSEQVAIKAYDKRFAVVYNLLSLEYNWRLRLRIWLDEAPTMIVPSVVDIWRNANWYEREVFDLYGILFEGHPDLRRILTDYDFNGHPLRKDFPLGGEVELRYDEKAGRIVKEPCSIEPRVGMPKIIRQDNRYMPTEN